MGRYARPVTAEQLAQRDTARQQQLTGLHERLQTEVRRLRTGPAWQRWLDTAARLPAYSFRNQLLITAQRPQATAVAGYQVWQQLGRQVDRGERGIAILAPVLSRTPAGADPPTGSPPTAGDPPAGTDQHPGGQRGDGAARALVGFRVAYVWDVGQTSGTPLAVPPAPSLLPGAAPPGLWPALHAQVLAKGFTLTRGSCGPANGRTDFTARTVRVRADIDDAQAAKTLAHELAHVLLHDPARPQPDRTDPGPSDQRRAEVEAESVAYLVAAAHGLNTDAYSFSYVAGGAHAGDDTQADRLIAATAERVLRTAATVLAGTQPRPEAGAQARGTALHAAADLGAARAAQLHQDASEPSLPPAAVSTAPPASAVSAGAGPWPSPGPSFRVGGSTGPVWAPDRETLLAACEAATRFYQGYLHGGSQEATAARETLTARGVTPGQIRAHRLGCAPAGWTTLVDRLGGLGYRDEELLAAGLAVRTGRGTLTDRMHGRLIFPVLDHDGAHILGFLGRDLELTSAGSTAKYLNTATTALYRKGDVLHGLGHARAALAAGATAVLVEGPFDVLAVERCAPGYAPVAAVGTMLTTAQTQALIQAHPASSPKQVVLAFDGDRAGDHAALRAFPLLRDAGAWPLRARLPPGHDPASAALLTGDLLVAALCESGQHPVADTVLDESLRPWTDRLHWAEGRVAAARAGASVVTHLPPEHAPRQLQRLRAHLNDGGLATWAVLEALDDTSSPTPRRRNTSSTWDASATEATRRGASR